MIIDDNVKKRIINFPVYKRSPRLILEYPKVLISKMIDEVDATFASEVSEAYEKQKCIQMENLVYSNASADSIVQSPQDAWKEIRVEVEKAETDLKKADESTLIAVWRVSGDEALRAKCETELKKRLRNQNYVDTNGKLNEIFPLLKERDAIDAYEKKHPIYANRMDDFFDTDSDGLITEEDRIRMKYMVYEEADEDYREYFLKNSKYFAFVTTKYEGDSSSNFSSAAGGIRLNYYDDFYNNKTGPYVTVMHELGHDADYYCNDYLKSGNDSVGYTKTDTWEYKDALGNRTETKTIREIIQYDVFDNPNNTHSVYSVAIVLLNNDTNGNYGGASVEEVIEVLKGESEYSNINNSSQSLYDDVTFKINNDLSNAVSNSSGGAKMYEAVTDVTNGITQKQLYDKSTYYRHSKENYWDPANQMEPKELFAEYFSYNMTGDQDKIAITRDYFPEATKAIDEMVGK